MKHHQPSIINIIIINIIVNVINIDLEFYWLTLAFFSHRYASALDERMAIGVMESDPWRPREWGIVLSRRSLMGSLTSRWIHFFSPLPVEMIQIRLIRFNGLKPPPRHAFTLLDRDQTLHMYGNLATPGPYFVKL